MSKEKLILTDADGVLFNWVDRFHAFMEMRGHTMTPETSHEYSISKKYSIDTDYAQKLIREYNEGPLIEFLPPLKDAVHYVKKLSNHGFRFICVTSLSTHPEGKNRRSANLHRVFGSVFDDLHCLEMGENKQALLEQHWKDSGLFWIEDTIHQAEAGHAAGLKTVMIRHPYNAHYTPTEFTLVGNDAPWQEIYNLICAEYGIQI